MANANSLVPSWSDGPNRRVGDRTIYGPSFDPAAQRPVQDEGIGALPPRSERSNEPQQRRARLVRGASFGLALACASAAEAACPVSYFPETGLGLRRSLQPALPDLGSSGFGRTQPYADGTVSVLHGTEVSLIIRMQDDLVSEIGAELPLPAEPIELAKFNALTTWAASRFTSEPASALRARLLASILGHPEVGTWSETTGDLHVLYRRDPKALVAKIRKGPCG